ncbi:hypothetical protein [Salinisphaera sp.]|uniref:hypothetical protein n=1 Tax=Salinisphaera sp. TaxID=1914330 RepID=UPI002D7874A6|nr:hypothetical protein [Salinisphaera sp.]HET7314435.1 hypothetical protein [Salinisphaera sp.]
MASIAQLWLPTLLSAVGVFIASSILHMVLKFWHGSDYKALPNEDEVSGAIRKGGAKAGIHAIPYCSMEDMKKLETRVKFKDGPVGLLILRRPGPMNMGASLIQWFVFCLIVSVFCAYLAASTLPIGAPLIQVFRVVGTIGFMAYAFSIIQAGIWGSQPWNVVIKNVIDGLIYGLVTGALFGWLWP